MERENEWELERLSSSQPIPPLVHMPMSCESGQWRGTRPDPQAKGMDAEVMLLTLIPSVS